MAINQEIEHFLRKHDMPPTLFGRLAARDPRLVFDIRKGRETGANLQNRLRHFMAEFGGGAIQ